MSHLLFQAFALLLQASKQLIPPPRQPFFETMEQLRGRLDKNASLLVRSPSPVKREIPEGLPVALNAVAGAEQETEMFVEVVRTPKIKRFKSLIAFRRWTLSENFAAHHKIGSKIVLQLPTAERIVPLTWCGIQSQTASAVGRPRAPTFLHPQWQLKPRAPVT
jgi:hypothetical protein